MTGSIFARLAAARSTALRPCAGAALALAVGLTGCSTDDVMRPMVDVGQQTAAISPVRVWPAASIEAAPAQNNWRAPAPVTATAPTQQARDVALAPADDIASQQPAQAMSVPQADTGMEPDVEANAAPTLDAEPAVGSDQQMMSAPEPENEPEPVRVAALPRASIAPLPPSEPRETTYPRLDTPTEEPAQSLSSDEEDCRRQLKKLGVKYQDLSPIRDGRSCYIDHPVKVSAMGSVQMKPAATLTCQMALTFARWTKNELVPSARWRYLSGVKTIRQGSSYSCRRIAGSSTPSAHSQGNALDVMAIELNNGKEIDVRKQGFFAFRARKLLNNVRADGCEYFTTVLGPGYNYDHRNHFHFDLMQRKSGKRACH